MMPTDAELVDAAAQTYTRTDPYISDPVSVFLTERADGLVIAIEGSRTPLQWAADFFAVKAADLETFNHPTLGMVHAGFYALAEVVMPKVELAAARGPFAICGHSLGGAMALLLGGLLIDDGRPPVKIGAFAAPKVGGSKFVDCITKVPHCAYRYGGDVVPLVPFTLPDFPYMQLPIIELDAPHEIDVFAYHNIKNYVTGVHAYKKPSAGHWWEWWEKKL